MPAATSLPYEARVAAHTNPAARDLLELMARKRTNLCVSVDVTTKDELLRIVRAVGPSICMVKTHCDIIEDFDADLVAQLTALAQELDFQIFEDRKFADIGNTVSLQYSSGVHKIASWSHITNAHIIPGPGIISGLADVGLPLGRGLLLLAEMSSEGSLAKGQYTLDCLRFARARRDFVIGFIAQSRVELLEARPEGVKEEEDDFLVMSPGVALGRTGDGKGQQYRTPTRVVEEAGADVIIVGRGIYGGADEKEWKEEAERYRTEGWAAYERRVGAVAK